MLSAMPPAVFLLMAACRPVFCPLMPLNFRHRISTPFRRAPARIVLTLLLALAAAGLCVMLRTPLPWMIGPLVVTAALSMLGTPTESWTPLRNSGQWIIGGALGLYFTPQVVALVAGLWWAMLLNIVWALVLGLAFGAWLHRVHFGPGLFHVTGLSRVTTYFAAPIGAASEMTLMAERHGAQTELVASAHSLRVLLVTLIIPFGFQWAGLHGLDSTLPGARIVEWPGLALLAVLTGIGCWVMLRLERTNPWFIGALISSMVLTACGVTLSGVPQFMTNAAQLVIGVSLGVRFTSSFVHLAPRWLGSVAVATLGLIVLCAGFAWVIAYFAHIHWATMMLGTAPGGIAEMAITAKVLQLGVPLVTAFHVTRLAAVLLIAEPVYRWFYEAD
jgi:membrane AbrB-like protein